MSEDSSLEKNTEDSPARQMLASLARAARDMTGLFNDISHKASLLNSALENDVSKSIEEVDRLSSYILQSQLESLSAEKVAILSELTALRQEELQVIQTVAANLRSALTEKLNELLTELKNNVREQITAFQQNIARKETEIIQTENSFRQHLSKTVLCQIELLQEQMETKKQDLETLQLKHQEELAQESELGLSKLCQEGSEFEGRLNKLLSNYFESMECTVQEIAQGQKEKLDSHNQTLPHLEEKARSQLSVSMDFLEKLPDSLAESCRQDADLHLNMLTSTIKNLTLDYSAQTMSVARETEDKLLLVSSQLQALLRNYLDEYTEQSSLLLSRFERDARAAAPVTTEKEKITAEETLPLELFDRLKKEIRQVTREAIPATETEIEKSFVEFRSRLRSESQNTCTTIEGKFHLCRKQVLEQAESYREQLDELSLKCNELEQLLDETSELIGVMNPSSLDF